MKLRNSALAFAALLLAAPGSSPLFAADQAKNPPPATLKTPPSPANQPTSRPRAGTSVTLAPIDAYLGTTAFVSPRVTFSGGPAVDLRWVVPTCKFELQFPSLPNRTYDKPCNKPFSIDVPEGPAPDGASASLRVLGTGDLYASTWAIARVTYHKSPTRLDVHYGHGQLPPNLAPVAGVTAAEDVFVTLYKTFPDGSHWTPLPNRSLVVTVTGGQATATPNSNQSGDVSFQVLHVNGGTPTVDVRFQGDPYYAASSASAVLRPGGPPPHGHIH